MSKLTRPISDLSPAAKLRLIEDLWEDLSATPENIAVPEWQRKEVLARREEFLKNPGAAVSWEELTSRIEKKHGW
jgi:putative addiction module component (TIGR02574 family)